MRTPANISGTADTSSTVHLTPIWKPQLSDSEFKNVTMSMEVSTATSVEFLAPNSLDVAYYRKHFPDALIRRIADEHLSSVSSYSDLMMTEVLYSLYSGFTFMLVVQCDAVLRKPFFADSIFAFDYAGAPWDPDIRYLSIGRWLWVGPDSSQRDQTMKRLVFSLIGKRASVGNGGLSIRRVAAFQAVTQRLSNRHTYLSAKGFNEDVVFATVGPRLGLKVAPKSLASALFGENISISEADSRGLLGIHAPVGEDQ